MTISDILAISIVIFLQCSTIEHNSSVKDLDTKENNKYKPFNLEEAKAGKSVCTRGGHKAKIICFDARTFGDYPPEKEWYGKL